MMTKPMLRLHTAIALRRFWHLERALVLAYGGWIPCVRRLEAKAALAEAAWESSLTAHALRERVFELRYPDRSLNREPDAALVSVFEEVADAPDARGFLAAVADHLLPALAQAYERYLQLSDPTADGPTHRFLRAGLEDKARHAAALRSAASNELGTAAGEEWTARFAAALGDAGGVPVEGMPHPRPSRSDRSPAHGIPDAPARDERYLNGVFYWPDNFDPDYPYGEGMRLRLRTAISHLNEVWAVETAGAILFGLGPELGWEFIMDAARWVYDESRHMAMGRRRLEEWGFAPAELPLGTFIYGACAGQSYVHRLAMLAFFETKNIGKKAQRAVAFGELGDAPAQRDMEFDWADEAIHAAYGRRWLGEAMAATAGDARSWPELLRECESLVAQHVADAPAEQKRVIYDRAAALVQKIEGRPVPANGGP